MHEYKVSGARSVPRFKGILSLHFNSPTKVTYEIAVDEIKPINLQLFDLHSFLFETASLFHVQFRVSRSQP